MIEKNCAFCGLLFTTTRSDARSCSRSCGDKLRRRGDVVGGITAVRRVGDRGRDTPGDRDLYIHMLETDLAHTTVRLARVLYGLPHGTTIAEAVEELDRRGEKVPFTVRGKAKGDTT